MFDRTIGFRVLSAELPSNLSCFHDRLRVRVDITNGEIVVVPYSETKLALRLGRSLTRAVARSRVNDEQRKSTEIIIEVSECYYYLRAVN